MYVSNGAAMKLWQRLLCSVIAGRSVGCLLVSRLARRPIFSVISQSLLALLICPRLVGEVGAHVNAAVATSSAGAAAAAAPRRAQAGSCQLLLRLLLLYVQSMFSQVDRLTNTQHSSTADC